MKTLALFLLLTAAAVADSQYLPNAFFDTPLPNSPVIGVVTVSGWAIDNTTDIGSGVSLVQIAIDSQPRATVQYGLYRPDVCAVYPGRVNCPNVGFTAQVDTSVVPPGGHTIHLWVTNSDTPYTSTRVFDLPILVASSFSADGSFMTTGPEISGGTAIDGFTGLPTILPTASNPIPLLSIVTSQQNAPFGNRILNLGDSYTKTILFAPPNSPVYMLGAQYANPTAPPYNFCLTPSSYFAAGTPCQVGVTDGSGSFQISGSLSVFSISSPFPPQLVGEDWYVGGVADANWVGSLGYSLHDGPVPLSGITSQSSTYVGYPGYDSWRAVDRWTSGNWLDGSLASTNYDSNAWWQIDLGQLATIANITVWGRTDGNSDCCANRLNDFWVFVSNAPFQPTDTPASLLNSGIWGAHITQIPSPNVVVNYGGLGRYVRVQLSGANYLTLAEVQVFGTLSQ